MFDIKGVFQIQIISGGKKVCRLKFPDDKFWIDRNRRQRILRRPAGKGGSQSEVARTENFDHEAFQNLLIEPTETSWDEYDAQTAIELLQKCDNVTCEEVDGNYLLTAGVFGGDEGYVTVTLKPPTRKQAVEYGRGSVKVIQKQDLVETTVSIESSRVLFDDLFISSTDYAVAGVEGIPICHKDEFVVALLAKIRPEA